KIFYWMSGILSFLIGITGIILIFRGSFSGSWLVAAATIHGLSSVLLVSAVIVHAYLGSAANPGTWRVLIDGKVSEQWCRHHHPHADIEYKNKE
ncbi:MAG: formate dehydrogenase subunit gamma, partial [Clostridia bacterium]|nr:formate dehydrogenase subunit gamma [Clostridia bacterium]